jgi:hypothetical protein
MQRRILVILAAAVAVVALAASGETNEAEKVGSSGEATNTESSGQQDTGQVFAVGDEVKLGDWTVTVIGVTDPYPPTNQFNTPQGRFVGIDTSVKNNSGEPAAVSSLLCFDLRDSTGQTFTQAFVVDGPAAPDGEVDPGGVLRGTVFYDVPVTATGLQLKFKCDLFSTGSATINL